MTHKEELKPFIQSNGELFSSVGKDLTNEETIYHCCFGCKKMMKDKKKMRRHMKDSEECCEKHREFLKDIGIDINAVAVQQNKNSEHKIVRDLQEKIDHLEERIKDYQDGSIFTVKIDYLEKSLFQATTQVTRLEEALRIVPCFMKPELWKYCNRFREDYNANQRAIIPGEEKKTRRDQYLHLIRNTPLLQVFFTPSFTFLQNQHAHNGEYEGLLCGYFNNLPYIPLTTPSGDPDSLSRLPDYDSKKSENSYLEQLAADESPPKKAEVKPEAPRSQYPSIIQSSKRPIKVF